MLTPVIFLKEYNVADVELSLQGTYRDCLNCSIYPIFFISTSTQNSADKILKLFLLSGCSLYRGPDSAGIVF